MERDICRLSIRGGLIALAIALATPVSSETRTITPILTASDAQLAKDAFKAVSASQWEMAHTISGAASNPLPRQVIEWLFLTDAHGVAEFSRLATFIRAHPDWPARSVLETNLEKTIPINLTPAAVATWFEEHPPRSATGAMRLGAALVSLGEIERGQEILKETWVSGDFTKREDREFYFKHRGIFVEEDHASRLQQLLWNGKTQAARRMLFRVSPTTKQLGIARIYLMERHPDVDKAIASLPKELLNDPGLVYERARWRRRAGKDKRARQLLFSLPDNLVRPEKWWHEIKYQIRVTLKEGSVTDAYQLAANNSLFGNVARAEANWLAGWIALRFLNEPDIAYRHFKTMHDIVSMPISQARAAYWAAQASTATGDKQLAHQWLQRGVSRPTTFYGQLSSVALGYDHLNFPTEPQYDMENIKAFEERDIVQITRMLGEIGESKLMRRFAVHLAETSSTPAEHALVARLTADYSFPQVRIAAAKRSVRSGVILIDSGYPMPFASVVWSNEYYAPEPALVMAVSRQESEMDPHAISSAGARGLLQLMPQTAKHMARKLKLRYDRALLLEDPQYNLRLGTAYLAELLDKYEGCYVLALAAYNAGPARVKKWLWRYGDPRTEDVSLVDWIELLPYHETRNYIQRVLETTEVYRDRLGRDGTTPTMGTWQVMVDIPFETTKH